MSHNNQLRIDWYHSCLNNVCGETFIANHQESRCRTCGGTSLTWRPILQKLTGGCLSDIAEGLVEDLNPGEGD